MRHFLKRLFSSALGIGTALGIGATATATVSGQTLDYRAPDSVPAAWQQYAQLIQYRFHEWLSAGDDVAYRFHQYLENRVINENGPPETLTVKVWVAPDGEVERVEFPSLPDPQADQDLHSILTQGNIGEPPPADMLQPLHLKISLKWRT